MINQCRCDSSCVTSGFPDLVSVDEQLLWNNLDEAVPIVATMAFCLRSQLVRLDYRERL
jgi:hypothetical protein